MKTRAFRQRAERIFAIYRILIGSPHWKPYSKANLRSLTRSFDREYNQETGNSKEQETKPSLSGRSTAGMFRRATTDGSLCKSMKVLIIDDYRSHGESLVELVHVLGHDAQYAPNYSEAEWLLNVLPFDLALLDFDMPQMTGPMIAAKLAQRFPKVRPVIMSAHAPGKRRKKELGDWTFLQKPLTREQLQNLFSDFVREQRGCGLMLRASFQILKIEATSGGDFPSESSAESSRETEE